MASYLDEIMAHHRASSASDSRDLDELWAQALASTVPSRASDALDTDATGIIAEIKRRSPSRGEINMAIESIEWAKRYENGGATAISVLTDHEFFGGSLDDLRAAKSAVDIPLLRKDFIVSKRELADARICGASMVLLIVNALDDTELAELIEATLELSMLPLVEVHSPAELTRALAVDATCIGVNQRSLETFEIDDRAALSMADLLPDDVFRIAESGLSRPKDIASVREAGYHAALVGEAIVTAENPEEFLAELVAAGES